MDAFIELFNPYAWVVLFSYVGLSFWISRIVKDKGLLFFLITGGFTLYKVFRYFYPNIGYANVSNYYFVGFEISYQLFTIITAIASLFSLSSMIFYRYRKNIRLSILLAVLSNITLLLTSGIYMHVDWTY